MLVLAMFSNTSEAVKNLNVTLSDFYLFLYIKKNLVGKPSPFF